MPTLEELGWDQHFAAELAAALPVLRAGGAELFPARVIEEQKRYFRLATPRGECWGELIGKFLHAAETRAQLPAVGDWVVASSAPAAERASIHGLLARKTKLSRRAAGDSDQEQLIAANVDVVFVAESLSQATNMSRFERYLAVVRASGARPVVLLTKADLCGDVA